MIEIRPDPKHPHGGFAEVTIQGTVATTDPVMLSVYNSYQQKWLSDAGWQPNKALLAARVAEQDGDTLRLVIGPDIVNHIEEDTPIRLEIGGSGWDAYWPDDINAGPDEAVVGDIGGTGLAAEAKKPTVIKALPTEEAPQTALTDAIEIPQKPEVPTGTEENDQSGLSKDNARTSRQPLVIAGIVALLALAAVAYFLFLRFDPESVVETAPMIQPKPEQVADDDTCNMSTLSTQQGDGFSALAVQIRTCGGKVSADNALRLVEQAAVANDADALALFGVLYDSAVTDDAIEGTIGLTFSDAPARAAGYYARAVAAGSQDAPARLKAVCLRLLLKSDTLSNSAREDYCS